MIVIYEGPSNGLVISVDAATVTRVTVRTGAGSGDFAVSSGPTIPGDFIDTSVAPSKLKSWPAIQAQIKAKRQADPEAAAKLAVERDALLAELRDIQIDAAASGFLGAGRFSLAAEANARLAIHPLNMASGAPDDAVVLSAVLAADVAAAAGPQGRAASARLEVIVTHAGLVAALPALSAETGLRLPALDLRWPQFAWPSLDWAELKIGNLNRLLRLDLPLGGASSPLEVRIPGLEVHIARSAAGVVTFSSGAPADGGIWLRSTGGDRQLATITGFSVQVNEAGVWTLTGTVDAAQGGSFRVARQVLDKPRALPFRVEIEAFEIELALLGSIVLPQSGPGAVSLTATIELPKVVVRSKKDPALLLALAATYKVTIDVTAGTTFGRLTDLKVVEPYPLELAALAARTAMDAAQAAADAAAGILRLIGGIRLPAAPSPNLEGVLERVAALLRAAVSWLAELGADVAGGLLGLAEDLLDLLLSLVRRLRELWPGNATAPHLTIEVQLDSRTYRPRRIVIAPAQGAGDETRSRTLSGAGLDLTLPAKAALAVVVELDGAPSVALLAKPSSGDGVTLATDLWLSGPAGPEAVRDTRDGERPKKRLITVTAKPNGQAISLARWSAGRLSFFEAVEGPGGTEGLIWAATGAPTPLQIVRVAGAYRFVELDADIEVDADLDIARRLPFMKSGPDSGSGPFDDIAQYIEIKRDPAPAEPPGPFDIPLVATLKLGDDELPMPVVLELDPQSLTAQFRGGTAIPVQGTDRVRKFDLFGLKGVLKGAPAPGGGAPYTYFVVDIGGSPGLALAKDASLVLSYGKIASDGGGLEFKVTQFRASSAGLDLDAEVDPSKPVTLAGVGMPFRFRHGALSVKRSRIQSFSIAGAGQLPPELVGEANASIAISFGRDRKSGDLVVQSAEAKIDKSSDPIVCHGTWFDLSLTAIGLEFRDFSNEKAGYHFFFTISGSAEFRPRSSGAVQGLLKNLAGTKIVLDKAPLARDSSMLTQSISFQVPIRPPKTFNIFNLFKFELRGIGFHPSAREFGGKPAICLSGQVNFVEAGDAISPRFDFHALWIAPPKADDWVPQVRFDGLTVGLRFGGQASIEGTAMAVDDQMPSLFRPGVLPGGYTARGFLASGKLSIQGWASMGAAMGFLELSDGKGGPPRQAFFIAANLRELSYTIPTPVGNLYLRQVGFGFGFRYTLAAFNAADQVRNVTQLITALDEISRYQGDLASIRSWEPEAEGDRVTLALSGVISLASASSETSYNQSGEKDLSNPVLLDVVVALRSDLTFFLAARVWLCFNYEDYNSASAEADWLTKPTLRGYTYLSVPRQEFLSRLIADGKGEIGKHPALPQELIDAMKGADIRWSATTYIRPGLFHQEFGWPYELGFSLKNGDRFRIDCSGGMIQRIEDGAMLFGIAFKASGWAQIGGAVGGRSFGASVHARADFSLDTKLIAYIAITNRDDTLFYGSIAFESTIRLDVRVWLEFSVGFSDIHLEIGFSQSLTVSLALEVAATPSSIAGRGSAAVGVSGFGRSLRLGIGVEFNAGELVKARARVERFLTLGLTASTPDPAKALSPPAPSPPREKVSAKADAKLEQQAKKRETVKAPAPIPGQEPAPAQGQPLRAAAWWAMLFRTTPDAAGRRRYVMTFVPRDHTETGLTEDQLPTHLADGPFGGFYPPPRANPADDALLVQSDDATLSVQVTQLGANGQPLSFTFTDGAGVIYDNAFRVAAEGKNVLELGPFLADCYIVRGAPGAPTYHEPFAVAVAAQRTRLPEDRHDAAEALREAGRDLLDLEVERRRAAELEERRSAAIASFADSAFRLATGGERAQAAAAAGQLDARAMGLAFLVDEDKLDELFNAPTEDELPRAARFRLWPAQVAAPAATTPANVHLFNPPDRMFDQSPPRFAGARAAVTPSGVRLSWDLEPPFGDSQGVWRDPEFRLLNYRIERRVTGRNDLVSLWPVQLVTSKPAAPAALVRDPVTGEFVWRFIQPDAQFVDDLADLPEVERAAILRPEKTPPRKPSESDLLTRLRNNDVVVRYVVTPVDVAGAVGQPLDVRLDVAKLPPPARANLRQAVLEMEYSGVRPVRGPEEAPAIPGITLTVDDPALPRVDDATPVAFVYALRVRAEGASPTGLYGADALTDAKARPGPGDFAERRIEDEDFTVRITLPAPLEGDDATGKPVTRDAEGRVRVLLDKDSLGDKPAYERFLKAIGVTTDARARLANGPRPVRFAIRPVSDDPALLWTTAEAAIAYPGPTLAAPTGSRREPLRIPVEVFEHPLQVDPAPLLRQDMTAQAGRLLLLYPPARGGLAAFRKSGAAFRLRDPARRVGTKIRWRPRPGATDAVADGLEAKRLAPFFGGFNLFELDAAGEVEGAATPPGVADLDLRFDNAIGGTPGSGEVTLAGGATQATATELRISLVDVHGNDRRELLDDLVALPKGEGRIILAAGTRRIDFEIVGRRLATGYRTLLVRGVESSGANPLQAGDALRVIYRGPSGLRPVARVMALPESLARLDPAEIADFGKVEARYPSDTLRADPRLGGIDRTPSTRLAPWYSPAESYAAWPERSLRRSLGVNVDEMALTSLMAAGRPTRLAASVAVTLEKEVVAVPVTAIDSTTFPYAYKRDAADTVGFACIAGERWSTQEARSLVQSLLLEPDARLKALFEADDPALHTAEVILAGVSPEGGPVEVRWNVDLTPRLHPALEDAIDWARYAEAPDPGLLRVQPRDPPTAGDTSKLDGIELRLEGWPSEVVFDEVPVDLATRLVLERDGALESDLVIPVRDRRPEKVAALLKEALASGCVTLDEKRRADARRAARSQPELFAAARVVVLAHRRNAQDAREVVELGAAAISVAILALPAQVTRYRRYEPVLEPPPRSDAKDVAAWMDETPGPRDPHGWSILRRMGLATGLRLFDTETDGYASPKETLERLEAALATSLRRYGFNDEAPRYLGAPFVDLITRPGGTTTLADFDGGSSQVTPEQIDEVLDTEALALVQISLRPMPQGMAELPGPIGYFKVVSSGGDVVINLASAAHGTVVEILDLSGDLAAPPLVTIARPAPAQVEGEPEHRLIRLRRELIGGTGPGHRHKIGGTTANEVVALLRVTVVSGVLGGVSGFVEGATLQVAPAPLSGVDGDADPFGRFPEITAERFGALVADEETATGTYGGRVEGHPEARKAVGAFRSYAGRIFPTGWPAPKAEAALLARLPEWTRRFLEHGATESGSLSIAFAEVTRPEPWRVGVGAEDGLVGVLLTHEDLRRRAKRYMVEPFGRYEPIAEAVRGAAPGDSAGQQPRDYVRAYATAGLQRDWNHRFVDVILPRTEPVAPPTLLAARRIAAPDGTDVRRTLEFLYARHPEEVLSESNVTVEGALSFESVNVGFFREFAYSAWAAGLPSPIDPLCEIGDWAPPEPAALIEAPDAFGGLARTPQATPSDPDRGRYEEGWRGVIAMRTESLPWFFRTHAVAYAAAGVVVSDPAIGTVPEGPYDLALPWKTRLVPGEDLEKREPRWRIVRSGQGAAVVFEVALPRFADSMTDAQRDAWLKPGAVGWQVMTLPNPEVRWQLQLEGSDPSGASTVAPELEMSSEVGASATFKVKAIGTRFTAATAPSALEKLGGTSETDPVWWRAAWQAGLPDEALGPAPVFEPKLDGPDADDALWAFETAGAFAAAEGAWPTVAPAANAQLQIQRPGSDNVAGWQARQADALAWADLLAPCMAGASVAQQIHGLLTEFAGSATPPQWWEDNGGGAGGDLSDLVVSVAGFPAGLPHLPDGGRPATLTFTRTGPWTWPERPRLDIDLWQGIRGLAATLQDPAGPKPEFREIRSTVKLEIRRLMVARKDREDSEQPDAPHHIWSDPQGSKRTFLPQLQPLPETLDQAALSAARAIDTSGARVAPWALDVVTRLHLRVLNADADELLPLIKAVAKAPFAAAAMGELIDLLDAARADDTADDEADIHLPASAWLAPGVTTALAGLTTQPDPEVAVSILLRTPPDTGERAEIAAALLAAAQPRRDELAALIEVAIADQVFGPGRRPVIQATQGASGPLSDNVAPKSALLEDA